MNRNFGRGKRLGYFQSLKYPTALENQLEIRIGYKVMVVFSDPSNPQQTWIASRTIDVLHTDGRVIRITPKIGQPYKVLSDEWACPVAIDGFHERIPDIRGIDAWQALQLSQQLLAKLLQDLLQEGCRLYWPQTSDPMTKTDLFAWFGNPNLPDDMGRRSSQGP